MRRESNREGAKCAKTDAKELIGIVLSSRFPSRPLRLRGWYEFRDAASMICRKAWLCFGATD
jgi:hypothetical protein